MNVFYLIAGLLLFALITADILKTAFSNRGGGLLTNALSRGVWGLLYRVAGGRGRSRLLEYAGQTILFGILLSWIAGLWLALFLVLMSDPNSVVDSTTRVAATPLQKLYYAGFTLSTLGVGDYNAASDLWRIVTDASAFAGLVFITAAITYFVPVLSAVSLQNQLSLQISSMGTTPQQLLINSWSGKDFSPLYDSVSSLCQMIMQHTLNHHAYPVIHYFHNRNPRLSVIPGLVLLDEVHQLLVHALDRRAGEDRLRLNMLTATLEAYLAMMRESTLARTTSGQQAPVPVLRSLEQAGLPVLGTQAMAYLQGREAQERRQLLTALLENDGWTWKEVYGEGLHTG